MARSSILSPQALQLYVQLLQMSEPSPRRRRFASESRSVPQVLQRKQSRCHLLPAIAHNGQQSAHVVQGSLESGESVGKGRALEAQESKLDGLPSSKAFPSSRISPQPLQGKTSSSMELSMYSSATAAMLIEELVQVPPKQFPSFLIVSQPHSAAKGPGGSKKGPGEEAASGGYSGPCGRVH
jgi:hypothetical protein